MYTKDELKEAYKSGGWVTTWSDMGYDTKWKSFDDWFDNEFIKEKFPKKVTWIIPNFNQYDELWELLDTYKVSLAKDSENKLIGEIDVKIINNDTKFIFKAISNNIELPIFEIGVYNYSLKYMSLSFFDIANGLTITDIKNLKETINKHILSEKIGQKLNNFFYITNKI